MNAVLVEDEVTDKVVVPAEARAPRGKAAEVPMSVSAGQVLSAISAGYLPPCAAFSPQSSQPVWDIDGIATLLGLPSGKDLIAELKTENPRFHGVRSVGTIGDMPVTVNR
jgi:hypothetical protein